MKQGCDGGLQFVFGVGNGQAMACLDRDQTRICMAWHGSRGRPLRAAGSRCVPTAPAERVDMKGILNTLLLPGPG